MGKFIESFVIGCKYSSTFSIGNHFLQTWTELLDVIGKFAQSAVLFFLQSKPKIIKYGTDTLLNSSLSLDKIPKLQRRKKSRKVFPGQISMLFHLALISYRTSLLLLLLFVLIYCQSFDNCYSVRQLFLCQKMCTVYCLINESDRRTCKIECRVMLSNH